MKLTEEELLGLKRKALGLSQAGFTTREVGKYLHRSHEWAAQAIREMKDSLAIPVDNEKKLSTGELTGTDERVY